MTLGRLKSFVGKHGKWIAAAGVAAISVFVVEENRHRILSGITIERKTHSWNTNWDLREPESLAKPRSKREDLENLKSTATRHIFLIRHGQYNLQGFDDNEHILTELGRKQALVTGLRLKELNLKYNILLSSTMSRAMETADLVAQQLEPGYRRDIDPMLREGAPIPPEPPISHWKPPAKQYLEDGSRIDAAFVKYFHRAEPEQKLDSYEIIVCHANVIRYFVCKALQYPPEGWLRISLAHGSITYLMIRPSGRVVLKYMGNCGHLPVDLVTYS